MSPSRRAAAIAERIGAIAMIALFLALALLG
jgi:hypothetical protein